jgi:hypothetical protein
MLSVPVAPPAGAEVRELLTDTWHLLEDGAVVDRSVELHAAARQATLSDRRSGRMNRNVNPVKNAEQYIRQDARDCNALARSLARPAPSLNRFRACGILPENCG